MQKQFVNHEIALKLKELGFDEKCFAIYDAYQDNKLVYLSEDGRNPSGTIKTNESMDFSCLAPLWQQAIDWFREKYKIIVYVQPCFDNKGENEKYQWMIKPRNRVFMKNGDFKTYEEAREQAILKAMSLCRFESTQLHKK